MSRPMRVVCREKSARSPSSWLKCVAFVNARGVWPVGGKPENSSGMLPLPKTSLWLSLSNGAADRLEPLAKFKLPSVSAGSVCSGYAGWTKDGTQWRRTQGRSAPVTIGSKRYCFKRSSPIKSLESLPSLTIWFQFNNRMSI